MSQNKDKVSWCMKKALREIDEKGRHRGLIKVLPNKAKAKKYIEKAEHYLEATLFRKNSVSNTLGFSPMIHYLNFCSLKNIKTRWVLTQRSLVLKEKFSDVSASTVFYAMYHSLLAILAKFGYESGNQECTFALIYFFIEDKKISLEKDLVDKISSINSEEESVIELREKYQYGIELSMKEELFNENFELAKKVIGIAKVVVEE